MATRLYPQNASAPYTPATIRGAWDKTSDAVIRALGLSKAGAVVGAAITKGVTAPEYDVLLARFVSLPVVLSRVTLSGTLNYVLGMKEASATEDLYRRMHVYVTAGDSDTVRGTLIANDNSTVEMSTTAAGRAATIALTPVDAQRGDRIVVELGYRGGTTAAIGTLYYGGTNATDLTVGASGTTYPGWLEFSQSNLFSWDWTPNSSNSTSWSANSPSSTTWTERGIDVTET